MKIQILKKITDNTERVFLNGRKKFNYKGV